MMQIGDSIHGFTVLRRRESAELEGTLWEMRHERTGARLCWLDNGDSNKLFCIAFKTVPWDDTGVFHILEHSVLGGSERYPVKEPFLDLLKGSMNTFLNAMTFPDKTIYPVSSRNDQDYLNLVQVYLDAVFCPAIYTNPNIFRQEGWHYELREGEDTPVYNGVVYNEMKGAYASVDGLLLREVAKLVYPDSCYGKDSGGDPEHIPELTAERFLDAHRVFYHPGNARIWLDGAVPLEKVLRLMDEEYLCRFGAPKETPGIALQEPVPARSITAPYEIGAEEDEARKAYLVLGKIAGTWSDIRRIHAMNVLASWLTGSVEAPLTKAVLDSGLAQDISVDVQTELAQPALIIILRNTEEEHRGALRKLLRDTAEKLLAEGLDKKALAAALDRAEFRIRDRQEPAGLIRCITSLSSWLYDGDPMLCLEVSPVIRALREALDTDYYENILRDMFLDDEHLCEACLVPSRTRGEETRAAEQARLQAAAAGWTEADRERIMAEFEELERWHNQPDTPEQTAALPQLALADVSPEPFWTPTEERDAGGVPGLFHPAASNGIVQSAMYFTMADQDPDEIPVFTFLCSLLGNLPTAEHTVPELNRLTRQKLGRYSFQVTSASMEERRDARLILSARFSSLDEYAEEGADLVAEMLTRTVFRDRKAIRDLLSQQCEQLNQMLLYAGNSFAVIRARSSFSAGDQLTERIRGLTFLRWMNELRDHFDERADQLITDMERIRDGFFTRNRLLVSQTATRVHPLMDSLASRLAPGEGRVPGTLRLEVSDAPLREAVVIPAGVSFAGMACHTAALGETWAPDLTVLGGILTYGYLWNEVRVKGGAYGCGFQPTRQGSLSFYSYRDPAPMNSGKVFDATGDYLEAFCTGDEALDRYIISAIAATEPLLSPDAQGAAADAAWFSGVTLEKRRAERRAMLSLTKGKLLQRCAMFRRMREAGRRCVIGCQAALEGLDESWHVTRI